MDKKANMENPMISVKFMEGAERISYSNFAFINYSSEELLLDFGITSPGKDGVEVFSRVAFSPRNAKLFMLGFIERMKAFETQFGEIKLPDGGKK